MVDIRPFETIYPNLGRASRIRNQHGALAMTGKVFMESESLPKKERKTVCEDFLVFLFFSFTINSILTPQSFLLLFSNPVF